MTGRLQISITPRGPGTDSYDWVDLDLPEARIGKMRCRLEGRRATVYSVHVFPEFQGQGFGRRIIDYLKERFEVVEADRVRPTAVPFWEHMGFREATEGNWVYTRPGDKDSTGH
jgi:GNAT superfamily N-acetyltransferase